MQHKSGSEFETEYIKQNDSIFSGVHPKGQTRKGKL